MTQRFARQASLSSSFPPKASDLLQRNLIIGSSSDPLEREADRVADRVLARPTTSVRTQAPMRIQRSSTESSPELDPAPDSVYQALSGSGAPLEPRLLQDMELRFGRDFSNVRVYNDAAATRSAADLRARAYTVGNSIVFGSGQFAPQVDRGRRLLAHELAHTVQQGNLGAGFQVQRQAEGNGDPPFLAKIQIAKPDALHVAEKVPQGITFPSRMLTLEEATSMLEQVAAILWRWDAKVSKVLDSMKGKPKPIKHGTQVYGTESSDKNSTAVPLAPGGTLDPSEDMKELEVLLTLCSVSRFPGSTKAAAKAAKDMFGQVASILHGDVSKKAESIKELVEKAKEFKIVLSSINMLGKQKEVAQKQQTSGVGQEKLAQTDFSSPNWYKEQPYRSSFYVLSKETGQLFRCWQTAGPEIGVRDCYYNQPYSVGETISAPVLGEILDHLPRGYKYSYYGEERLKALIPGGSIVESSR